MPPSLPSFDASACLHPRTISLKFPITLFSTVTASLSHILIQLILHHTPINLPKARIWFHSPDLTLNVFLLSLRWSPGLLKHFACWQGLSVWLFPSFPALLSTTEPNPGFQGPGMCRSSHSPESWVIYFPDFDHVVPCPRIFFLSPPHILTVLQKASSALQLIRPSSCKLPWSPVLIITLSYCIYLIRSLLPQHSLSITKRKSCVLLIVAF